MFLLAVICASSVGTVVWFRSRPLSPAAMSTKMPPDSIVLYIDFAALRRSGLMNRIMGSKTPGDPDYQRFVTQTGFDFRDHLSSAMLAITNDGKYMLLNGTFDWKKLKTYAEKQGGKCYVLNCRMTGSAPERRISFLPIRNHLMALAVSPRDGAAQRLMRREADADETPEVPDAPFWLAIPGPALQSSAYLPPGSKSFARIIGQSDRVLLALNIAEDKFVADLEVQCQTEREAKAIADQLTTATVAMRNELAREGVKPNPRDFSGPLTSGTFHAEGVVAKGQWHFDDALLDTVLNGGLN